MATKSPVKTLIFGGILPVVAFTLVEEKWGVVWGLVCGMAFGVGEIAVEFYRDRKVSAITWAANAMILTLGGVSLITQEGIWFKMQPAIIEAVMAVALVGSVCIGRPLLVVVAESQRMFQNMADPSAAFMRICFRSLTIRMGLFFMVHAFMAAYAAFYWSSRSWALLKGVGFTASLVIYMAVEVLWIRVRIRGAASRK